MKRARALQVGYGIGALSLVGALGLFSPVGQPVVAGIARMARGGCPFGYDQAASPAQRERASSNFAASHRGDHPAVARPALGFTLDQTTREQVLTMMSERGVQCKPGRGMADLTCDGVPSNALDGVAPDSPTRNLWFTFGTKQQLLSVVGISKAPLPEQISAAFLATRQALSARAGEATMTQGDAAPQALAQGALRQASAEFRFTDYYALARATNLGHGFLLTEEYRSLAD